MALVKGETCGQQLLEYKLRATGTLCSRYYDFSIESLFYVSFFCCCILRLVATILSAEGFSNSYYGCKHALPLTHTLGQHTQSTAEHNPWLGLMNGPSLNYFVKISFRTLKKRSSLFIHFTFAAGLQYLRLCLRRIYPLPCRRKQPKRGRERKAIYTMYIK